MDNNDIKGKIFELLKKKKINKNSKIIEIIQDPIKKKKYNTLKNLFSLIDKNISFEQGNPSKIDIDCNKIKGVTLYTRGDGNCLFHAVIGSYLELTGDNLEKHVLKVKDGNFIQVSGNETAENMRKNVGEWYEINKDKNIPIVDKGVDLFKDKPGVCTKCGAESGDLIKIRNDEWIPHPSLDQLCPYFENKKRESNTKKRTLFEELNYLYNDVNKHIDVNEHINDFKTNNEKWGDDTSIYAISDIYKIQIYVCNNSVFKNNFDANNLDTYQLFKNSENEDIGFKNKNDILNGIKIFIHLNNDRSKQRGSSGNHYQSIKITDENQKKILMNKSYTIVENSLIIKDESSIKDKIFKLLNDKNLPLDSTIRSLIDTPIHISKFKAYTILVNLFNNIKK